MHRGIIAVAFAVGVAASACRVMAEEPTGAGATNETVITSKRLTFDYRNHYALFEEDVVVTDPSVKILADKLTVLFDEENSAKTIVGTGNVRIVQTDKNAVCEKAVYQVKAGRLDLSGNPVLRRGKDVLKGKVITFWRDQEKMEGEDVQLVIQYESGRSPESLLEE